MSSINSVFAKNSPYESSIQQMLQLEGLKRAQLQAEQKSLKTQKSALSEIDSKLSSFNTLLTAFRESADEKVQPLSGSSSDAGAVDIISTSGINNPGNYTLSVSQLAKEDIVLTDALANTGTDLNSSGSASFDIALGSESPLTVTVNTTGLNNQEVLEAMAGEINNQLGDRITASVFQLGDGTSRLSFKSVESGKDNRISVSNLQEDSTGLAFSNIYTEDELNARFTLDSVSFERSSNTINDVINGFAFELKQQTAAPVKLSVSRNIEEAKSNIESFIEKFNAVNSVIRSKTFLDGESGNRGPLQKERSIRNLSFGLRQTAFLPVSSLSGNSVNSLSSIGIEMKQDGTMHIKDASVLEDALATNSKAVAELFSANDGIAATLQSKIDLYVKGSNNIFSSINDGIDRKMERLDDRIASENKHLAKREEQLRAEFARLDQVISQGQSQFNQLMTFQNQFGF